VIGARLFSALGAASYAIYVLHWPLRLLYWDAVELVTGRHASVFAPWSGLLFIVTMVAISLVLDRLYDGPVRKWAAEHLPASGRLRPASVPSLP
jgi:peptidoglycan/LPS O-acetylase OafA/YrhL